MKNTLIAILILTSMVCTFSCVRHEDDIHKETNEVLGDWQLYKSEKLESIVDQWTGTEWIYVDKWFANNWEDGANIIKFQEERPSMSIMRR